MWNIRHARGVLAVLLAVETTHAQAVLIVNPTDSTKFDTVQAAVDAAADGDVVLIQFPYMLTPAEIVGKSLIVMADSGYAPGLGDGVFENYLMDSPSGQQAHTVVRDLLPNQRVVLNGLAFDGLQLKNVQGQVWLEDSGVYDIVPAMRASDVADLVMHNVYCEGPDGEVGWYDTYLVGRSLELISTKAVLHDVVMSGGDGADWACDSAGACSNSSGADGLLVSAGSVWLSQIDIAGGDGGLGAMDLFQVCHAGGNGGNGLVLSAGADVGAIQMTAAAGVGASGPDPATCSAGTGGAGVPGTAVMASDGTLTTYSENTLTLSTTNPCREGGLLTVTVAGVPGTNILFLVGTHSSQLQIGAVRGPLLTGVPDLIVPVGALPASGSLQLQALLPDLGSGVQAATLTLQVLAHSAGHYVAGPGTTLLMLDSTL